MEQEVKLLTFKEDPVIEALQPAPNDLVVVPYNYKLPEGLPFLVYRMKYLLTPSVIKSGVGSMNFFEKLSAANILGWLTGLANPDQNAVEEVKNVREKSVPEGKPMPVFYRYSRPLDYKNNMKFGPKGGVAFLITLSAKDKTLEFSYSLCDNRDLFNKQKARSIAKERFESFDAYLIKDYDPDLSAMTNIKFAIKAYLNSIKFVPGPKYSEEIKAGKSAENYYDSFSEEPDDGLPRFKAISPRCKPYELYIAMERI